MRKVLALVFVTGALLTAGIGSASAGEVTGNGDRTGAYTKSNSECSFSGLEDGHDLPPGSPYGPGAQPQNWGQIPAEFRAEIRAEGFGPFIGCNGHLAGRK